MNPQDQPNSPNNDNTFGANTTGNEQPSSFPSTPVSEQSSPEADAAALQAIDALESEELGDAKETPIVTPVSATAMPQPIVTAPLQDIPPASSNQPTTPDVPTVDPTVAAAGAATVVGASLAGTQTPASVPTDAAATPKKSNKIAIVLLVVILVLVAVAAGYFVWQSME